MNALVAGIDQQLAVETQAAVAQITAGGEVIVRGVTIRHQPAPTPRTSDNWFVEMPLPATGKHASVERSQFNDRSLPGDAAQQAAESAAFAILKRLRAEHKTPEAVHAALQMPVPLVRVYRGGGVRITTHQAGQSLVYEMTGQSIAQQVGTTQQSEADLLDVLLAPMGLTIVAGWIVPAPRLQEQP